MFAQQTTARGRALVSALFFAVFTVMGLVVFSWDLGRTLVFAVVCVGAVFVVDVAKRRQLF